VRLDNVVLRTEKPDARPLLVTDDVEGLVLRDTPV
jgi:hypothetical protein